MSEEQNVDALDALLGAELKIENNVYIKRLNTHFTVKAIDGKTVDKLKEQSTYYTGKKGKRTKELDEDKFGALMITESCINPDFSNDALKEKYGASTAEDCVKNALLAGEIAKLSNAVLDASGFDDDDDGIDDVKN